MEKTTKVTKNVYKEPLMKFKDMRIGQQFYAWGSSHLSYKCEEWLIFTKKNEKEAATNRYDKSGSIFCCFNNEAYLKIL